MSIKPSSGRAVELIKATTNERKAIGRVVSAIMAARVMTFEKIYHAAHGSMQGYAINDKDNLGKGIISQSKAATLFQWIVENHLPLATEIAPEVFDPSLLTRWRDFLREHSKYGNLTFSFPDQLELTERSKDHLIAETPITLGQRFIFELNNKISGRLLALESAAGKTYPFSLHPNQQSLSVDVKAGMKYLPLDADGKISPLIEKNDTGLRSYCFLIAEPDLIDQFLTGMREAHPIKLDKLDQIALAFQNIDSSLFEVHSLNIIFSS
jgi:hypothetical protein